MILKNALYHKSAKGTEAIATRQYGLGPKLRSMLIMIDGKRGFDELGRLSGALGDTEQLLNQLLADGFIEQVAGAAAAPPATREANDAAAASPQSPATPATPATPSATALSFPDARRYAVRRLTDIMGPTAEQLCLRIEQTRNVQELDAALVHAEEIVRGFSGAQKADTFAADVRAHLPG